VAHKNIFVGGDIMEYTNKVQLRYWMNEKGFELLVDLEKKAGLSPGTLSSVKKTGRASYSTLEALAKAFGIKIPELFMKPDIKKYQI
jgi:transcriptional regulator with XRE-family HTH domain